MRRVLAISLAILFVVIATRGVVAQEAGQSAEDRLLDILKDRQIISNKEYGELQGMAARMRGERAEADRRLGDLDRSIADYLKKEGDAIGSNVTYTKGSGFRFASTDGLFSLNLGGLIDVEMSAVDRDRDEFPNYSKRDVTNIFLAEARWHFFGHAFDPNLTYFMEFAAKYSSYNYSELLGTIRNGTFGDSSDYCGDSRGVSLLDAYVDWNICDWTTLRAGRFKVPFGYQRLVHKSDLAFGTRALPYRPVTGLNSRADDSLEFNPCCQRDRDEGIMFHDTIATPWFGDFLADMEFEYAVGIFDGVYAQSHSWFMPAWRAVIYPFGDLDEQTYVEGDWRQSDDPKMGLGASYWYDQGPNHSDPMATSWGLDFSMRWYGFSLTAEWQRCKYDERNFERRHVRAWYLQAGYMALPNELEILARYGKVAWPWHLSSSSDIVLDQTTEWSVGAAYYWEGHNLKALFEFGRTDVEWDEGDTFSTTATGYEDHETWFARIMFQLEW